MIERYLVDALRAKVGQYILNNNEKIRINPWKGEISGSELLLNPEAIESLIYEGSEGVKQQEKGGDGSDIGKTKGKPPVQMLYGSIGHLELNIPWRSLRRKFRWRSSRAASQNKPGSSDEKVSASDDGQSSQQKDEEPACSIVLSDVYILLSSPSLSSKSSQQNSKESDKEYIKMQRMKEKERKVEELLSSLLRHYCSDENNALETDISEESLENDKSVPRYWQWAKKFASYIVSSLKVTVRNVHVRYEDEGFSIKKDNSVRYNKHHEAFSVGITLQKFFIETQSDNDLKTQIIISKEEIGDSDISKKKNNDMNHKVAKIDKLAIYWDSHCDKDNLMSFTWDLHEENLMKKLKERESLAKTENKPRRGKRSRHVRSQSNSSTTSMISPDSTSLNHQPSAALNFEKPPMPITKRSSSQGPKCQFPDADSFVGKETYFLSCFQTIDTMLSYPNGSQSDTTSTHNPGQAYSYSFAYNYLLEPIAATLHLTLANNMNNDVSSKAEMPPPNQARISIETWRSNLSRSILEDIAYSRKKLSYLSRNSQSSTSYSENHDDHINDEVLIHLKSLRPTARPDHEPRLWWKYAIHATRIILKHTSALPSRENSRLSKRVGWLGLVNLLSLRKKYISLYQKYLMSSGDLKEKELIDIEEQLDVKEIALFRASVHIDLAKDKSTSSEGEEAVTGKIHSPLDYYKEEALLINEIGSIVERLSKQNSSNNLDEKNSNNSKCLVQSSIKWNIDVVYTKLSLELSDGKDFPIILLSCSSMQKFILKSNGSWVFDGVTANLYVTDLMTRGFPQLLSRKKSKGGTEDLYNRSEDRVDFGNGRLLSHSASLFVENEVSQTKLRVRLSPLQVVYSTMPFYSLHRMFSAAKTTEFVSDYERFKVIMSKWKSLQSAKLVKALSERRKLITQIDVAAPVILIPDEEVERMLVLDLGRLTFCNASGDSNIRQSDEWDEWELSLSNVQVLSSQSHYDNFTAVHLEEDSTQLVEPFSLELMVRTNFVKESKEIYVNATLPRLVFNMTTGAIRLTNRLRQKWNEIQKKSRITTTSSSSRIDPGSESTIDMAKVLFSETDTEHMNKTQLVTRTDNDAMAYQAESQSIFNFQFSAPFVALHIGNDVDGRDPGMTPLVEITIQKIRGNYKQHTNTEFSARLGSLYAVDLYQRAGSDYKMLLASTSDIDSKSLNRVNGTENSDLVEVKYTQFMESKKGSILSIGFHELYVEWNPETIAAVQKAMRLPIAENSEKNNNLTSKPERMGQRSSTVSHTKLQDDFSLYGDLLQEENSTSFDSSFPVNKHDTSFDSIYYTCKKDSTEFEPMSPYFSPKLGIPSPRVSSSKVYESIPEENENFPIPPFLLTFSLSKLYVNFNKDLRKCRLFSVQMDHTNVEYLTKPLGGIKISATMGNFAVNDNGTNGGTLYTQMIGLKMIQEQKSIFLMNYESFPRDMYDKHFNEDCDTKKIVIDNERGTVSGCDSSISLNFSPMRFVFMQQFWLELSDYFFEGILGYEVWGAEKPETDELPLTDLKQSNNLQEQRFDSDKIKFNSISIEMAEPVLLLPITYRSPHHIRLELNYVRISNNFCGKKLNTPFYIPMQWYNNYSLTFSGLRIMNWNSKALSSPEMEMFVLVTWPVGITAPLIIPKWNVKCNLSEFSISLQKEDFALFNNFLYYNVMEDTRHADELDEKSKENQLVSFWYEMKGLPPSTYQIVFNLDCIKIHLLDADEDIGDIICEKLQYQLLKKKDYILRQQVTCSSIILSETSMKKHSGSSTELLLPLHDNNAQESVNPILVYNSATKPNGDHYKTLEIRDGCIYLVYSAWVSIQSFFTNISDPEIFDENMVKNVIQIGDRWYPIFDSKPVKDKSETMDCPRDVSPPTISPHHEDHTLYHPKYQFLLRLQSPRIVLVSKSSQEDIPKKVTLRLGHLEFMYQGLPNNGYTNSLFIHELELFTNNPYKKSSSSLKDTIEKGESSSLLHPLSWVAHIHFENNKKLVNIVSETIRARAAYSDLSLAMNLISQLVNDTRHKKDDEGVDDEKLGTSSSENDLVTKDTSSHSSLRPIKTAINARLDGFILLIIDDSLKHFAAAQELIKMSIAGLEYNLNTEIHDIETSSMEVRLGSLNIIDYLQHVESPYRVVATSNKTFNHSLESDKFMFVTTLSWKEYCIQDNQSWGFNLSPSMILLIQADQIASSSYLIEILNRSVENKCDEFDVRFRTLNVQWNPSTIVALKRFFEGLQAEQQKIESSSLTAKESHTLTQSAQQDEMDNTHQDRTPRSELKQNVKHFRALLNVEKLTIYLNKEQQGRRLLQVTYSGARVAYDQSKNGLMKVVATVEDFYAIDPNLKSSNRMVLEVLRKTNEEKMLMSVHYETFLGGTPESKNNWVNEKAGKIDDFLSIELSATRLIFLRSRTEELFDYLSNGILAAGISATTRAAKGFLECRIKTRSAMQVIIETPILFIPRHYNTCVGITLKLGSVNFMSWYEEGEEDELSQKMMDDLPFDKENEVSTPLSRKKRLLDDRKKDWWRCLSVKIDSFLRENVSLSIVLRKPSWYSQTTVVRGRLSRIECTLTYQDWSLFKYVLEDNISKVADVNGWERETEKASHDKKPNGTSTEHNDTHSYVDGAQVIRYGNQNQSSSSNLDESSEIINVKPLIEFEFELGGLYLTLHRNDDMQTIFSSSSLEYADYSYDLTRLRVQRISAGLSYYASSDLSAYIKLYEMDVYDLGEEGRNCREILQSSGAELKELMHRKPSVFPVIAEGYDPIETLEGSADAPQLVLTFDNASGGCPVARLVVDCLSLNIVLRPLLEIMEFISCSWSTKQIESTHLQRDKFTVTPKSTVMKKSTVSRENFFWNKSDKEKKNDSSEDGFQIKLVAHYPRVFFLADESDLSTRALVLRGLAVVNLSVSDEEITKMCTNSNIELNKWSDMKRTITVDAHLNGMESYINPNVKETLGSRSSSSFDSDSDSDTCVMENTSYTCGRKNKPPPIDTRTLGIRPDIKDNSLGIALIEPVTATIEFSQSQRQLHPTRRSFSLSMQPVSTMLSFEDLSLIEGVLNRMSEESNRGAYKDRVGEDDTTEESSNPVGQIFPESISEEHVPDHNPDLPQSVIHEELFVREYDVMFTTSKLGLVLRKTAGNFKVEKITVEQYKKLIQVGDTLVAIDDESISLLPFRAVIQLLGSKPRPLRLRFRSENIINTKSPSHIPLTKYEKPHPSSSKRKQSTKSSEENSGRHSDKSDTLKLVEVTFKRGCMNGLGLKRCVCGDVAIVESINQKEYQTSVCISGEDIYCDSFSDQSEVLLRQKMSNLSHDALEIEVIKGGYKDGILPFPIPRPGAFIVGIDGELSADLGFQKTMEKLLLLTASNPASFPDASMNDASLRRKLEKKPFYTLIFLEADASNWGSVDKVEISIAGLKLSLIDDINGRDMPLLRGGLSDFNLHLRQGMGLKTSAIKTSTPSLLYLPDSILSPSKSKMKPSKTQYIPVSDLSELILKFKMEAQIGLEYYNARIGMWEPLIESCRLQMQVERQSGNLHLKKPRAGSLSLLVSDNLLKHDKEFWFDEEDEFQSMANSRNNTSKISSFVCVNVTDAALEMLIKTANEWVDWRKSGALTNTNDAASAVYDLAENQLASPKRPSTPSSISIYEDHDNTQPKKFHFSSSSPSVPKATEESDKSFTNHPNNIISPPQATYSPVAMKPRSNTVAAQKAAQVALKFARKRGAATQKKGDSAKPFVFRNRTGVNIAFVKQMLKNRGDQVSDSNDSLRSLENRDMGENHSENKYFPQYDPSNIYEIKDGDDLHFNMNVFNSNTHESMPKGGKRVRTYDGQFPFLSVAFDPSLEATDYLRDLPVVKVGQLLTEIHVKAASSELYEINGNNSIERSIALIWTVELQNNRRLLTLSSSISITVNGHVPMEIGYAYLPDDRYSLNRKATQLSKTESSRSIGVVQKLGLSKPTLPYFLPIWLHTSKPVSIYVRPASATDTNQANRTSYYDWSTHGILKYSEIGNGDEEYVKYEEVFIKDVSHSKERKKKDWNWSAQSLGVSNGKSTLLNVECMPCSAYDSSIFHTAWLSCIVTTGIENVITSKMKLGRTGNKNLEYLKSKVMNVCIGSTLSVRNLLPIPIEWEIAREDKSTIGSLNNKSLQCIDGSKTRQRQINEYEHGLSSQRDINTGIDKVPLESSREEAGGNSVNLESGLGVDVYSCNIRNMSVHARFRCHGSESSWSEWALLKFPYNDQKMFERTKSKLGEKDSNNHHISSTDIDGASFHIHAHQLTVQSYDSNGVPLSFGIKVFPKSLSSMEDDSGGVNQQVGIDVILYADLWMRNLSSLPIVFGAPDTQIFEKNTESLGENSGLFLAEAALMEIASVLELGERGKELKSKDDPVSYTGADVCILPSQNQSKEVFEEVFEWVEIRNKVVTRRWWASEHHERMRPKPSTDTNNSDWKWDNHRVWSIDCSGEVDKTHGWESCQSLSGHLDNLFDSRRRFNQNHAFRRRRWFRRKLREASDSDDNSVMFHHALINRVPPGSSKSALSGFMNQTGASDNKNEKSDRGGSGFFDLASEYSNNDPIQVCCKVGDGRWSTPIIIPPNGSGHGVIRVYGSRWPLIVEDSSTCDYEKPSDNKILSESLDDLPPHTLSKGCLKLEAYDFSYHISILEGSWGEVSRLLILNDRFLARNDSKIFQIDLKQVGAPESSSIRLDAGQISPFHWADHRLPKLVCVRPVLLLDKKESSHGFKWSGGFDPMVLGMIPLRVRKQHQDFETTYHIPDVRTLRTHIEIRPGTDGTGITLSFREENSRGEGSLFRIENFSPFSLWIAQDGMLANPTLSRSVSSINSESSQYHKFPSSSSLAISSRNNSTNNLLKLSECNIDEERHGEVVDPMESLSYGLDVPYRQGKYAHRRAASIAELLMLRVSLAPLSTREGIESTQVISLTTVGNYVRLSPSKLIKSLGNDIVTELLGVRILAIVCADGPTRVLRLSLMKKDVTASGALGNVVRRHAKQSEEYLEKMSDSSSFLSPFSFENSQLTDKYMEQVRKTTMNAAVRTIHLVRRDNLMTENEVRVQALRGKGFFDQRVDMKNSYEGKKQVTSTLPVQEPITNTPEKPASCDNLFSIKASFQGFVFSIVDSVPSEIAVVSLRSINIGAKWNSLRTNDASARVTIGWLQVDNHCPNAPYPIALRPNNEDDEQSEKNPDASNSANSASQIPFLAILVTFAPEHTSGIPCLRSITLAPSDVAISLDLAFIMRIQQFILSIQEHLNDQLKNYGRSSISEETGSKEYGNEKWDFPDLVKIFNERTASTSDAGTQKIYFEGMKILPCNISLSVAQARALTRAQATLEGHKAAAVHAAVRKGDLLLGTGAGVLGVKLNNRNSTTLAIIRGVFKSIIVDALLRCDAASLSFPGVAIRYHIVSVTQLQTYLSAHYFMALRSNVPALLGSLSAFGNPIGLIRGLGDGVSDFVSEPIKGLKKSVEELDPSLFVDGVARGAGSLARHTVGGFADSASLLTETLSKNMAVLTLDRGYAQKRDRGQSERDSNTEAKTFVNGVGSGGVKLLKGVVDGVTGVVKAPIRGAEKRGVEGFAKGVGKGLIGLVIKPVIGLSDAATDVMIGVKGSVEGVNISQRNVKYSQIRPRRALYGRERSLKTYDLDDATAAILMTTTRLAGELYLSHCLLNHKRIALLSIKHLIVLGEDGRERMLVTFRHVKYVKLKHYPLPNGDVEWGLLISLVSRKNNDNELEAINCGEKDTAIELRKLLNRALNLAALENI